MKASALNKGFYKNKRVFVTGHTGFKGAWLNQVLSCLGATFWGYALPPEDGSLYTKTDRRFLTGETFGDTRDRENLIKAVCDFRPEIILHLAAVVTVQDCCADPYRAFSTNIMGTVNVLEATRFCADVKSVVVITTDKVYENKGDNAVYKVGDALTGTDPVSASNTGAEYVLSAYKNTYLHTPGRFVGIASARPGNVIAGGDHVTTRLIPSILEGFAAKKPAQIRNPDQTRSWQSVIDALNGYLTIGRKLYESPAEFSEPWNIGPTKDGIRSVGYIYDKIRQFFNNSESYSPGQNLADMTPSVVSAVKESRTLGLDIEDSQKKLGWQPEQTLDKILFELTDFFKRQQQHEPEQDICRRQIREFFNIL